MRTVTAIIGACAAVAALVYLSHLDSNPIDDAQSPTPQINASSDEPFDQLVDQGKALIKKGDAQRVGREAGGSVEHINTIYETQFNPSPALQAFEQYNTPITTQVAQAKAVMNCGYRDGNWYQSFVTGATLNVGSDPMAMKVRQALTPLELETGEAYLKTVANDAYDTIANPNDLKASCESIADAPFIYKLDALQIQLSSRFR